MIFATKSVQWTIAIDPKTDAIWHSDPKKIANFISKFASIENHNNFKQIKHHKNLKKRYM